MFPELQCVVLQSSQEAHHTVMVDGSLGFHPKLEHFQNVVLGLVLVAPGPLTPEARFLSPPVLLLSTAYNVPSLPGWSQKDGKFRDLSSFTVSPKAAC